MRKIVIFGATALMLAVVAGSASAAPAPKATGGVNWVGGSGGDLMIHASFNAHGTDPAKGEVVLFTSDGSISYKGDVECYAQNGNRAALAGPITEGGGGFTHFIFWVEDNGEGKKASGPDRIQTSRRNAMPACSTQAPVQLVTGGNLQVHE